MLKAPLTSSSRGWQIGSTFSGIAALSALAGCGLFVLLSHTLSSAQNPVAVPSSKRLGQHEEQHRLTDGWRRTATGWQWIESDVSLVDLSESITVHRADDENVDKRSDSLFRHIWPAALATAEVMVLLWCLEQGQSLSTLLASSKITERD